jgi:adenylate cyclase
LGPDQQPLRATLGSIAADDPDRRLADSIRRAGRVLLPFAFGFEAHPTAGRDTAGRDPPAAAAYQRFDPSLEAVAFPLQPSSVVPPIPPLVEAAAGFGHVTIAFDRDGAPRYEYLALPYDADFYPSLSVRAVAAELGVPWTQVGLALGRGVRIGPLLVPTDHAMRLLINYHGPSGTYPTWSFVDMVRGAIPPGALNDRLVLIGAAATGVNDTFRNPFGSTPLPGVERMANVIDTMLHGGFIQRPDGLALAEPAAVLATAGLVGLAIGLLPIIPAALVGLALIGLWLGLAQALLGAGLWLSVVTPEVTLALTMVAVLLFRHTVIDRERRRVRSAFSLYLPPALVKELAAHPERLKLGGESRDMTVLFADMRGFTTVSERLSPQAVVQLVNRFFTPMTEVIHRHHGTVDKYIGDCVMAFWNAPLDDPDHARHAAAAALDMMAEIERLAGQLARDMPELPGFAVGIGLNSGPCCVGNLGSLQKFGYSVVGNTVNVASRIEGLCKLYQVPLLVGDGTRAATPELPWLVVDQVAVRGHQAVGRIHTLWRGVPERAAVLAELYQRLLEARLAGETAEALALLAEAEAAGAGRLAGLNEALRAGLKIAGLNIAGPGAGGG